MPCLEELERFFRLRYRCEQLSFFERTSNVCNHKAFHFILCMPHQPPTISLDILLKSGQKLKVPRKADIKMLPAEKGIGFGNETRLIG